MKRARTLVFDMSNRAENAAHSLSFTPALSLGERENRSQLLLTFRPEELSKCDGGRKVLALLHGGLPLFPLPEGEYVFSVAQICNLPYRRFVIGRAPAISSALALAGLPQNAILRYRRLQICATRPRHALNANEGEDGGEEERSFRKIPRAMFSAGASV